MSEHLVGSTAFKAAGTGDPRPAGSIPVHLRHADLGNACGVCAHEAHTPHASGRSAEVTRFEQALSVAGFDPGLVDGVLDDATMNATVRLIEFHADNPELHSAPDAPYTDIHAEASRYGTVRTPVLLILDIAGESVAELPARSARGYGVNS